MEWTKGYVADIGYTAGFYRECAPNHLAFAALTNGRSPGLAFRPKRVLELGFGQGLGLALLAAANPDIAFEGCDFNPEHVANAKRMIQASGLSNLTIEETSFEEAARLTRDNDVDVISLHGIFSWVAREAQDAIVAIMRQRLQPLGLIYISYNCMPGWADLVPIRQFILEVKRLNPGRTSDRQLTLALDLLKQLKDGGAAYFTANPGASHHMDTVLSSGNRIYLAHEYLDEHWDVFQFSEVVRRMSEAKLSYLCSAALPENNEQYSCRPELSPVIKGSDDPILRETLRDYAINKRFRRDIFARGTSSLTQAEQRSMFSELRFVLTAPRSELTFKFPVPVGELNGRPDLYGPIADLLANKIAGFDELAALPPFGEANLSVLLDCLAQLINAGQVLVVHSAPTIDVGPAQRFNRMVVDAARAGRFYYHLASPIAGTGITISDTALLMLSAVLEGEADDAAVAARHSMSLLKRLGQAVVKDGKAVESEAEGLKHLEGHLQPLLATVPIWRRLGIF